MDRLTATDAQLEQLEKENGSMREELDSHYDRFNGLETTMKQLKHRLDQQDPPQISSPSIYPILENFVPEAAESDEGSASDFLDPTNDYPTAAHDENSEARNQDDQSDEGKDVQEKSFDWPDDGSNNFQTGNITDCNDSKHDESGSKEDAEDKTRGITDAESTDPQTGGHDGSEDWDAGEDMDEEGISGDTSSIKQSARGTVLSRGGLKQRMPPIRSRAMLGRGSQGRGNVSAASGVGTSGESRPLRGLDSRGGRGGSQAAPRAGRSGSAASERGVTGRNGVPTLTRGGRSAGTAPLKSMRGRNTWMSPAYRSLVAGGQAGSFRVTVRAGRRGEGSHGSTANTLQEMMAMMCLRGLKDQQATTSRSVMAMVGLGISSHRLAAPRRLVIVAVNLRGPNDPSTMMAVGMIATRSLKTLTELRALSCGGMIAMLGLRALQCRRTIPCRRAIPVVGLRAPNDQWGIWAMWLMAMMSLVLRPKRSAAEAVRNIRIADSDESRLRVSKAEARRTKVERHQTSKVLGRLSCWILYG